MRRRFEKVDAHRLTKSEMLEVLRECETGGCTADNVSDLQRTACEVLPVIGWAKLFAGNVNFEYLNEYLEEQYKYKADDLRSFRAIVRWAVDKLKKDKKETELRVLYRIPVFPQHFSTGAVKAILFENGCSVMECHETLGELLNRHFVSVVHVIDESSEGRKSIRWTMHPALAKAIRGTGRSVGIPDTHLRVTFYLHAQYYAKEFKKALREEDTRRQTMIFSLEGDNFSQELMHSPGK